VKDKRDNDEQDLYPPMQKSSMKLDDYKFNQPPQPTTLEQTKTRLLKTYQHITDSEEEEGLNFGPSSAISPEKRDGFTEEMRRTSAEFDRILNDIFTPTLPSDDEIRIYNTKRTKKKRWLKNILKVQDRKRRELLRGKSMGVFGDSNFQKSTSMESVHSNGSDTSGERVSLDLGSLRTGNSRSAINLFGSELPQRIYSPNKYEEFTSHVTTSPSQEDTTVEYYCENTISTAVPSELKPSLSQTNITQAPRKSIDITAINSPPSTLSVGMPFEVTREMGTNNLCLKLHGNKKIDSSITSDLALILFGSLFFPPLLLLTIPYAIYRFLKYIRKTKREQYISRYIIFDNYKSRIEKRLYYSDPTKKRVSIQDSWNTSINEDSSPENTLVYKLLPLVKKKDQSQDAIQYIKYNDIKEFDIEKEIDEEDEDGSLYFVCCVLQNNRKIRLNREEINSVDIAKKKVRQLRATLEKSKIHTAIGGKQFGHKRKPSFSFEDLPALGNSDELDRFANSRRVSSFQHLR